MNQILIWDNQMTTKEAAYSEIEELVKSFKSIPTAQRKALNEMQTRLGYILPLFKALGWNTSNINEVSPEEKVSRGWVDFSFRIRNVPRYFLETKRVNEDLNDTRWVKQSIDYAWTKSVTWALLSDFEGLKVFNAEWQTDNPFQSVFIEFDLDSYLSDFDRLWWLSRSETEIKRLDKEAERWGKRSKRQPVSQHLFDSLKRWRGLLHNDYKKFNSLLAAEADSIVLRLLNRLIFIRTAEDREVEQIRLRSLIRELESQRKFAELSSELSRLFREFDRIYNSELFSPHALDGAYATPSNLKEVIEGLYGTKYLTYNFNALEADVLGTVYEQYLGSVMTADSQDKKEMQPSLFGDDVLQVTERRQKRKSQGIYYTPAFVTKYIIEQTVGKYLNEHGYNPSRPPRVLDMACGSGSFLIEAFDVIDDFVAKQRGHTEKGEVDFYDRLRQLEVLQNCIFGVDKDRQAVEVARLNLLLRGLHSREKLPMLENIALGDSLRSETFEINFSPVLKEGGFDVIVGNPPYVRIQTLEKAEVEFFNRTFESATGNYDIYVLFVERALQLLKPGGLMGFILPNKFMHVDYGEGLRKLLSESQSVEQIVDFKDFQVFEGATTTHVCYS
jgi:type I restriction-modification system DNA methylase subunit